MAVTEMRGPVALGYLGNGDSQQQQVELALTRQPVGPVSYGAGPAFTQRRVGPTYVQTGGGPVLATTPPVTQPKPRPKPVAPALVQKSSPAPTRPASFTVAEMARMEPAMANDMRNALTAQEPQVKAPAVQAIRRKIVKRLRDLAVARTVSDPGAQERIDALSLRLKATATDFGITLDDPKQEQMKIDMEAENEYQRARNAAMVEARKQCAEGRGGGSRWPWRGACTLEAEDVFRAVKNAGPYQHIEVSRVRRIGHSAVAVFKKEDRNNAAKMIVFDPYKAARGDYWHQEKGDTWGGIFGLHRYKGAQYGVAVED